MQICKEQNENSDFYMSTCSMPTYNSVYCRYHIRTSNIKSDVTFSNNEVKKDNKIDNNYLNVIVNVSPICMSYILLVLIRKHTQNEIIGNIKNEYKCNSLTIGKCNIMFDYIMENNTFSYIKKASEQQRFKNNLNFLANILTIKYNWTDRDKYDTLLN